MTEATAGTDAGAGTENAGDAYMPPATQAELDRIITDRVNRTKAQFKDYGDLKAKAEQFDQLQAANQTETQRQAEELSRWQTQAEQWRSTAVTARIEALAAPDFEYPADAVSKLDPAKYIDAGGVIDEPAIRADLEAVLLERPSWRRNTGAATPRPPAPNHAQGTSAGGSASIEPRDQFAALFPKLLT